MPQPIVENDPKAKIGIIAFGSSHWAVEESRDQLREESGIHTSYLRLRAYPFTPAIGITAFASTAENFLARNADILEDTYGAVYLWNQTGEYDGSQQYYRAIGNSGYHYEGFSY